MGLLFVRDTGNPRITRKYLNLVPSKDRLVKEYAEMQVEK